MDDRRVAEVGPEVETEFEHLVPRWMFVLRTVPSRVAAALVIPVLFAIPLLLIPNAEDLRLGPFLVLAVVAVAALAGWWPTFLAGTVVTGLYWWYGVPIDRSFRLDRPLSGIALGAMVALVVGIGLMARRVERSVADVRALDRQRRERAANEATLRQQMERSVIQGRAVLELSTRLAAAETMVEVATLVADEVSLPAWPTAVSVAIVRDGHLKVLGSRGATPGTIAALERVDLTTVSWLGEALQGTPIIVDDRDRFAASFPAAEVLRIYPSGSWAVLPFRSESTVGLLSLYFLGPQPLTDHEQYLSLVSEILATSLERVHAEEQRREDLDRLEQAFAERDRIARTLSTTLLPPALPTLPGFTAAGWVLPAHSGEVAGDFYDLFSVADGDWVAVLGDVCGKGAEAAAVTSLARYAARVTALSDPDPVHIAEIANAALLEDPSDLFCTMAIVRFHRDGEQLAVTLAGHPQLRIRSADGRVRRVGRFGAALGFARRPAEAERVLLGRGDALVLHSDGLVERDPSFGDDELDALLTEAPAGSATEIAGFVQARILAVPATREDDLTLLVIARDL